MPNVVTPFTRKKNRADRAGDAAPRHRRDGWFDDQDQWHDAEEQAAAAPAAR